MKKKRNLIRKNSGFLVGCVIAAGASVFAADVVMTDVLPDFFQQESPAETEGITEAVLEAETESERTYETNAFTITASGSVINGVETEAQTETEADQESADGQTESSGDGSSSDGSSSGDGSSSDGSGSWDGSSSDGSGSLGGYDIFVTRYNTQNGTYLNPQNVGMPFNSPYNDYMYVVDEYNNLGWFASDRHQPEGKVCVYVFIPNTSKQVYSYENMEHEKLLALARLSSIKQTWADNDLVTEALQRLKDVSTEKKEVKQKHDFEFIIDDQTVYYKMADFRSPQAKKTFQKYRQLENSYAQQSNKLDDLRKRYASAPQAERGKMAPGMLDLEKRIEQLANEIDQTAILVRQQEKGIK